MPQISVDEIDRIVAGHHHDPHSILGAHPGPDGITVRALRPLAAAVTVVLSDGRKFPMRHFHEGVFEAILPPGDIPDYRLAVAYPTAAGGESAFATDPEWLTDDPYRHLPTLGEMDMYLIQEGRHEQLWKVLGAHVRTLPGRPAAGGAAPGKTGATPPPPRGATPNGRTREGAAPGKTGATPPPPRTVTSESPTRERAVPGKTGAPPPLPLARATSDAPVREAATPEGATSDGETPAGASATQRPPLQSSNRAHAGGFGPVTGTSFAVWAPNARGVRVIGDFNHWDGHGHPMRSLGSSGVWELFVPGADAGTRYKYEICGPDGAWRVKADPMAQCAEHPPATASVVYTSHYTWGDSDWLAARAEHNPLREPMSAYEVHLGSWRPGLSYRELADELTDYVIRHGLHPRRIPAGRRVPVRGLLGISGFVVLRTHGPVRQP